LKAAKAACSVSSRQSKSALNSQDEPEQDFAMKPCDEAQIVSGNWSSHWPGGWAV